MKNKTLWFGAGLAALVFATYKSWNLNQSIKYFQYSLSGLKFRLKNILQPELIFSIDVFNPNQVSVPVQAFFGTIKNGGSVVANFNTNSAVNIDGQRSANIEVAARINALGVIWNLIQKKQINSLQIDGMIKTGLFDMPFQKTVAVPALSGISDKLMKNLKNRCSCKPRMVKPARNWNRNPFLQHSKTMAPVAVTGTVN